MIRKAALILMMGLLTSPVLARESEPVTSSRVVASLVTDSDTVKPGQPLHVALRLRMKPGWHTYWSNPGDAGAPTELQLDLSAGSTSGGIVWPTPSRLPEGPVMAYGYTGEVLLPVSVVPGKGTLTIKASANWLVCEKICVPEQGVFELTLPQGDGAPSTERSLFEAAAARTPRASPFSTQISADGTLRLAGDALSPETVSDAWFFPSDPDLIDQDASQPVRIESGSVQLSLKPGSAFRLGAAVTGVAVIADRGGNQSSYVLDEKIAPGPRAHAPIWQAVSLALVGGLLLNFMPCVFPILAMKVVALARASGQSKRTVRAEAGAYTAGVIVAFSALGGLLIAARQFGSLIGWGFQFQSPVFVAGTAWLLFAIGLNMSGVFGVGGRLAGAGHGLTTRPGYAGSFFTGLLAVLVATPCTAPFMGAAIAAALASPPAVTIAIFVAMGLGLSSPYLLVSLVPWIARCLPRPGAWMDVLKNLLAFPMYGAAAWLVWVVSIQAGSNGVLGTVAGLVLVGFAAWAAGLAQSSGKALPYAVTALAALSAVALLPAVGSAQSPTSSSQLEDAEAFTPARLAALRAEGRPIFVNMTAAWCVTCLVNERVALSSAPVRSAFSAHHVAYLKGDWTRSDPAITAYLNGFESDGVPLYVYYPGGQRSPEVLPQILTQADVLRILGG